MEPLASARMDRMICLMVMEMLSLDVIRGSCDPSPCMAHQLDGTGDSLRTRMIVLMDLIKERIHRSGMDNSRILINCHHHRQCVDRIMRTFPCRLIPDADQGVNNNSNNKTSSLPLKSMDPCQCPMEHTHNNSSSSSQRGIKGHSPGITT